MTNGSQRSDYLARPTSGDGPPVLVLHAWWGLNQTIKDVCDRLAAEGFVAYAADLYDGHVTDQIPVADELSGVIFEELDAARLKLDRAVAAFQEAIDEDGVPRPMAAVGFSLGAFFALDLSIRRPQLVQAVVAFYGTHPGDFDGATAAYLGHYAEIDDFEPPSEVEALEASLRRAGRPATVHVYPGAGHWFFEPDRAAAYDAAAAALAWQRTVDFLRDWAAR